MLKQKSEQPLYAIVDIETNGSAAAHGGITEIAIFLHNGKEIIDEYQTLVNPEKPIPFHIQTLTGITPEMLVDAPRFDEVAKDVYSYLEKAIFVAHNVSFDFSFLHKQFLDVGIDWKPIKLCTVRLARKIFPGYTSYSLGSLCKNLNIPLHDRHRAAGDAKATTILFEQLLQNDQERWIEKMSKTNAKILRLPSNLKHQNLEHLPTTSGVYFFKSKDNKFLYIGKAINIRKRVNDHFAGNNAGQRRQDFLNDIYTIDFLETGNELMALLTEQEYIRRYWPKYNRALKGLNPKFGLTSYIDQAGYERIALVKTTPQTICFAYFDRVYDATQSLLDKINEFNLNRLLCYFYNEDPFDKKDKNALLKTQTLENPTEYNQRVAEMKKSFTDKMNSFFVLGKGRNTEEQSYILVKNNQLYAKGFFDPKYSVNLVDIVQANDRCESSYYAMQLILRYKKKHPTSVFPYKEDCL